MAAIKVPQAPSFEISQQMSWCKSAADVPVERIAAGACVFKEVTDEALFRGLSSDVFWLRFTLHNTSDEPLHWWLQAGHSRLQLISLLHTDASGAWLRTDTGLNVPLSKKPFLEAPAVLPLALNPGETRTYLVRVASKGYIALNSTLWEPLVFRQVQHGKELFQMLAVGGLLLASLFTQMVFLKTREKTYLYLGFTLLFVICLDLGFTGLLQVYLWPQNWPYPLELEGFSMGLALCGFTLFVWEFLGLQGTRGVLVRLLQAALTLLLASTAWGTLVSYGDALRLLPLAGIGIALASFGLFYRAWKTGSRPAAYLTVSFCILLLMVIYRALATYGLLPYTFVLSLGFSWYFVFITPVILAGTLKRSDELYAGMMRSRAEVQARVTFMAKMSHEFRSPLNTILGYAELQARGIHSPSVDPIAQIKRSGQHLLSMIDEILEHSRAEAGQLQLELAPVDWPCFISALQQSAAMMAQSHGNTFEPLLKGEQPCAVVMDERRLRQVLDNLLSNANRYTRSGTIALTCHVAHTQGRHCCLNFSVSDTGSGIAPEEIDKIFQPFTRGAAGLSSGIDGTGMGLAVVQQLTALMGGEVSVASSLGQGSTFSLSIECAMAERDAVDTPMALGVLPRSYSIVVIDDDAQHRQLMDLVLSDCGFVVVTESSGHAARKFLGGSVDLVVTDQSMQDGDGWSVLQDWSVYGVPVILLSAAQALRPHSIAERFQFKRTLLKPFNADDLIANIGTVLNIAWLTEEQVPQPPDLDTPPPPAEMLSPLRDMIDAGAVTDICAWLAQFGEAHPDYSAFSERATAACKGLDFAALRGWTADSQFRSQR